MTKLPNFSGKAFLAPMAGITDPAMRLLCKQMGAALVATELTSIHSIIAQSAKKRLQEFLQFSDEERPLSIQLFGSDIDALACTSHYTTDGRWCPNKVAEQIKKY